MAWFIAPRDASSAVEDAAPPHGRIGGAQYTGTEGDDHIHGRKTPDTIDGFGGDDVLNGRYGDDTLNGGGGDDVLKGSAGRDVLNGGAGNDILYGGTERQEQEQGGAGRDQLFGGSGDDRLYGGWESDILNGGTGKDRFSYIEVGDSTPTLPDTIVDFEQGKDKVAFEGFFKQQGNLHFIGGTAFSHTPGEVRFDVGTDQSQVVVDVDGDGVRDVTIAFIGEIHFHASDFSF